MKTEYQVYLYNEKGEFQDATDNVTKLRAAMADAHTHLHGAPEGSYAEIIKMQTISRVKNVMHRKVTRL